MDLFSVFLTTARTGVAATTTEGVRRGQVRLVRPPRDVAGRALPGGGAGRLGERTFTEQDIDDWLARQAADPKRACDLAANSTWPGKPEPAALPVAGARSAAWLYRMRRGR